MTNKAAHPDRLVRGLGAATAIGSVSAAAGAALLLAPVLVHADAASSSQPATPQDETTASAIGQRAEPAKGTGHGLATTTTKRAAPASLKRQRGVDGPSVHAAVPGRSQHLPAAPVPRSNQARGSSSGKVPQPATPVAVDVPVPPVAAPAATAPHDPVPADQAPAPIAKPVIPPAPVSAPVPVSAPAPVQPPPAPKPPAPKPVATAGAS